MYIISSITVVVLFIYFYQYNVNQVSYHSSNRYSYSIINILYYH